ncbi:EcsC family protein [Castellaniella sp.]|uniref:EcsC family protein n=1 Tax=Castellaniella sp. TaxID=1955812 RepID=UPI002AFE66E7|nr:EcsC family protein [Castellaniella sp.]
MQTEGSPAYQAISSDDRRDLEKAVELLVSPTLTARLSSLIGKPVEKILEYAPKWLEGKLQTVVETALSKAADAALWSLENKKQEASPWWNKTYAAVSGGVGGFFGMAGLTVELPISTTIMMRAVADVARGEGFDLDDPYTKKACIEVFALGGENKDDDESETTYYAMRLFTAEVNNILAKELAEMASKEATNKLTSTQAGKWMSILIEKISARFGIVITEKTAAQAVPVIGAASGAMINMMFTDFYQDMASGHFTVKRLENKYGFDLVREEFEAIRKKKYL